MQEEQGIYRDEVMVIMGDLADISADTLLIRALLGDADEGDDDGQEEDDA